MPRAFTEQGVAMLSSVLRSERAVQVNILIVRAFVRMRQLLASHKDLLRMLRNQERRCGARHQAIMQIIRRLTEQPPPPPKRPIGFLARLEP